MSHDDWDIKCRCGNQSSTSSYASDNPRLKEWYVCPACWLIFKQGWGRVIVMQEDGPLWDQMRLQRERERAEDRNRERQAEMETMRKENQKLWLRTRRILKKNNIAFSQ